MSCDQQIYSQQNFDGWKMEYKYAFGCGNVLVSFTNIRQEDRRTDRPSRNNNENGMIISMAADGLLNVRLNIMNIYKPCTYAIWNKLPGIILVEQS